MRIKTNSKTTLSDILIYSLVAVVLITFIYIDKAEANYNDEFCNSNKCKARIERLKECNWDVECTVNKTLEAMEKDLYKNISNLKKKSLETPKIGLNEVAWFVWNLEGFSEVCKRDNLQNSWGYWTRCYKLESTISEAKARIQKMKHLKGNYERVLSLNDSLTNGQIMALSSFYYNTGNYNDTVYALKRWDLREVKRIMPLYIMKGTKYEKGLIDRRNKELLKFNEK